MKSIGHVLVVDDHADTREFVTEFLRTEGYAVSEAENGRVALELLAADAEHVPALIILDLEMPVMTGWEFLSRIQGYRHLSRIPVLVTSGSHAFMEGLSSYEVAGFLRKPYGLDELVLRVATLTRS